MVCMLGTVVRRKRSNAGASIQATEALLTPTQGRGLAIKRRERESQLEEGTGSNEVAFTCFISSQDGGVYALTERKRQQRELNMLDKKCIDVMHSQTFLGWS